MFKGEGIKVFFVSDIILLPLYLIIIFLVAYLFRNFRYHNAIERKYFLPGLAVKIMGGLAVGMIYVFYYGGGDTFYYFSDSRAFNYAFKDSFGAFIKLLWLKANTYTLPTYQYTFWLTYFRDPSGWMADKVYGVLSILSFHSYAVMAVLISTLSFTGAWAMLRTFTSMYPQLTKQLALAILFVPSVFFWGSGVLKDSITFGCLGWITYSSYLIFFKGRNIIRNLIMLLFAGYIALEIKAYIVISFVPALLLWIFLTYRRRIGNQFLRFISGPSVLLISLGFGYLILTKLGKEFDQFSLSNVISTSERFQQWHGYLAETANASGYSLGHMDGSWQSVLTKFPAAVNVTLFRPYLWEVNNSVMFLASVESIFILGFTLYILLRNRIVRPFVSVLAHPDILFCFMFSMVFAFAVGFSSYNFGALVRYKIPCIPFFLVGLIILNYITQQKWPGRKKPPRRKTMLRPVLVEEEG